jgi:outer membrane protein
MRSQKLLGFLTATVVVLTLVLAMTSFTGAASNPPNSTIGYVETERIQTEVPDYVNLKAFMKDKEDEFNLFQRYKMQEHSSAMKALQEQATKEKEGKSANEQAEIDKKYTNEAQKKADAVKVELQKKQAELWKQINDQKTKAEKNVRDIISEVASSKKLTVVFDKNAIFYGGTDITKDVIEKAKKKDDKK